MAFIQWLKGMLEGCFSASDSVSFGRVISFLNTLYFLSTDAWFYHRTGHLVDNATLLTQLSVMTAFYVSSKGLDVAKKQ